MRYKYQNMNIYIFDDYEKMSKKAAHLIAGQINLYPNSVIGFATGSTPVGTYDELVKMYKDGILDFSHINSFNLDEYYPIEQSNPQSYAYFMDEHLFNHVNIKKENVHIPSGNTEDLENECEEYDRMIEESGGIDIQILGIGTNGHIGFNEPDTKYKRGTHLVELDDDTIKSNSRFFDSIDDVPKKAISMGIGSIMSAKKVVLMASGEKKAKIMKEMIFGYVTPKVPASVLQFHADVNIMMDADAAVEVLKLIRERGIEQLGVASLLS